MWIGHDTPSIECSNQAKNSLEVLPKFEANRSRGSCVMIGHPNKQEEISTFYKRKIILQ